MPSGKAKKEDKAKLDAAMAIAALSSGSWDPVEQQKIEANPQSRRTGARSKRGGRGKSLTKINSSNGSHVLAPVMPARAKNSAKLKQTGDVSNDLSESDIPKSQTAAVDNLQEGKFVRSAKQTVPTSPTSLTGPGSTWYRPPWYKPPESPFRVQSPLNSPELTVTNTVAVTVGGTASEAKQTNGFLMTSLAPLLLPGSGFQLVPVFPTGAFGQSGDSGLSPQLIGDPNLLQLLCQQGNFLQQGNYLTLSIPNRPNPSPEAVEELDGNVTAKAAGTASPAQLPGSLSTLRNYYNMTNTSEPLAADQPAAKTDTLSPSKVCITSPQTITDSYQITSDQFVKMRVVSSDVASLGDQGLLHTTRGERPTILCENSSASTVDSSASTVAVGADSSPVSMPGSLSSLRSYYSSLTQKTRQNASVGPNADHDVERIRTADRQTSSCETLASALNLSNHRQGDPNKIQGIPGIESTDAVRPCLSPEEESTGVAANVKKMLNNGINGQHPLSSSYVLGSASTSSAATTPLRILPKISESWTLSAASPASSQLSDDQNRPDSVASSISSVQLPPKKRRKIASPDPIEMPLDECCVVVGNEKVPLSVFMSRLDSRTHQIVINQIQSALITQQKLTATSSKLPVVASRVNLSSAAGLASCVPKLNANVSRVETRNCAALSIPSSVTSQDVHLSDVVGVTRGKKTAQVPAKKGYGKTDEEESHSNGGGSFQHPSLLSSSSTSSSLSQFSSPSSSLLSGQNPVLQPDEDGDLPLHVAVAQGQLRVVEQIVSMMRALNATIDCRNYLRQTPLHVAVVTGDDDIVRCLLEAGASPNIADRNGQNCFHLAVQYKQVECLKVLFTCTESRPDLLNYEGITPLHLAVKLNLPEAVSTLLLHGVQRDAVDGKSGHTALYMAADTNRLRIAEILLSFKANVQIASYSGCSPVQAASSKSFHEMVKLLVKHGGTSESAALTERSPDSKDSSEFGAHNRKGKSLA